MKGHRVLVVGASGALGGAICAAYAEVGATVLGADLDGGPGSQPGAPLVIDRVDVTDPTWVAEHAERTWDQGPLDSVVYAAGSTFTQEVSALDLDRYRGLMAVNLDGAFHVARAHAPRMLAAGRPGSFAFLSSTAGQRGEAGASAYAASKFGMIGLVQSFAAEVAHRGIRVNAICPGNVDSPLLRTAAAGQAAREGVSAEEVLGRFAGHAAARRLVQPSEVAAVTVFLASPAASAVTAASIFVDAGTVPLSGI